MGKKKNNQNPDSKPAPKRNVKSQLFKAVLGAACGSLVVLNYVSDPAKVVPYMIGGAVFGGIAAYFYG